MQKLFIISCLLFTFIISYLTIAQIALYPTATFIDPASRTGSMQVINTSDELREIDVKLRFGYFTYDSAGNALTRYDDSVAEKDYSLIPYIKVFPEKLLIPPKEQQTLRFLVRGIPEDKRQCWWVRIVAGSVPSVPQIDTVEEGKVQATIVLRSEMVGLIAFLKGVNDAALDPEFVEAYTDTTKLNIIIKQNRSGNAPYWGSINLKTFNSSGEQIDDRWESLALYFSCNQKFTFDKANYPPGKYKLKITINNEREEVPKEYQPTTKFTQKEFDFAVE